jgi:hypothetical protein
VHVERGSRDRRAAGNKYNASVCLVGICEVVGTVLW